MGPLDRDQDRLADVQAARPIGEWAGVPPFLSLSLISTTRVRLIGTLVAGGCAALLTLAASLTPDPSGMGTHRQLGLPPCSFVLMTGLPCPTCGMTTAFAWMMHGHPIRAALAQPLGAALCLATLAGAVLSVWMAATGRWVQVDWYRLSPAGLMIGLAASFFLAWGGKIGYGLLNGTLPHHP